MGILVYVFYLFFCFIGIYCLLNPKSKTYIALPCFDFNSSPSLQFLILNLIFRDFCLGKSTFAKHIYQKEES